MSCSVTLIFGVVSVERDIEKTEFACVSTFSSETSTAACVSILPVQVTTKPLKVLMSRVELMCSLIRLTFGSSAAGSVSGQICAAMTCCVQLVLVYSVFDSRKRVHLFPFTGCVISEQ